MGFTLADSGIFENVTQAEQSKYIFHNLMQSWLKCRQAEKTQTQLQHLCSNCSMCVVLGFTVRVK